MAKIWKRSHQIPWLTNDEEEDFFAAIGDYRLRVEQMDKNMWWWSVSHKGEQIVTCSNDWATCKSNAIHLAEGVYYGHMAAAMQFEVTWIKKLTENMKLNDK